ncbi:MAG: PIN domain-containing protein [Fibromonadaceae bacterium]|jgi:predicted nucleic acid-binding protein|nr:PIN domain-containing protein [Fibromonadaceae bacterium]
MKVIIDINVIMDWLFKRKEHEFAAKVVDLCAKKEISGFVCAHEITILSYFLEKEVKNREQVTKVLSKIIKIFSVLDLKSNILNKALKSKIKDYEDAVIEQSALVNGCGLIITRNVKDFENGKIQSITPKDFLKNSQILSKTKEKT